MFLLSLSQGGYLVSFCLLSKSTIEGQEMSQTQLPKSWDTAVLHLLFELRGYPQQIAAQLQLVLLVTLPECQSPMIKGILNAQLNISQRFLIFRQWQGEIPRQLNAWCSYPTWHRGLRKTLERKTHLQSWNAFAVPKQLIFPSIRSWFPQEHPSWMYETQRVVFCLFWHFHTAPQIIFCFHGIRVAGQSVCCQPGPDIHWGKCIAIWIPPSTYRNIVPRKVKNLYSALLLFPNYRIN